MAITPTRRYPTGYQVTSPADADRIRRQYQPNYSVLNPTEPLAYDPFNPAPLTGGARGDTGSAGAAEPSAIDTAPYAVMPPPDAPAGATPPQGNAAQRWQPEGQPEWMAQGGSQRTFNRANVARGARPSIDARATSSPQNAPTDFDATFGASRAHMGGAPVTWQQRQATNQQAITDARDQRGLPY